MKINLQELRESLQEEHIIKLVTNLGVDKFEDRESYIIFPTICHNPRENDASMKLYYYKDSHMFHCYTECAENFDIFDLIKKVKEVNKEEFDFYNTVTEIAELVEFNIFRESTYSGYISNVDSYKDKAPIDLKKYNPIVMDVFSNKLVPEWQEENITEKSKNKFNIRYYDYQNKVIIPHYDINGNLIGIRGRALNPEEIERYGKYAPVKVENTLYNHPLSFNLYGIYKNGADIRKYKTAIIFEGEKSVLLFEEYYDYNISVASCGSSLNYHQIELLIKQMGVTEIILAYDKEFDNFTSKEAVAYYDKLKKLCLKYSNYCTFYFIYDFNNLLNLKDSPIDKGKEVFEKLLKSKVKVRNGNVI